MKISPNAPCPCHSGAKYKKCCQKYHDGTPAPTPEKLMRSRYSAYALNKADYLMLTTHPTSPHGQTNRAAWTRQIEAFSAGTRFVGLDILATTDDTVTFRAILFEGDRDVSYVERSRFAQHDGRWTYIKAVDDEA